MEEKRRPFRGKAGGGRKGRDERPGRELSRDESDGLLLCWGRNPSLEQLERSGESVERVWLARGVEAEFEAQVVRLAGRTALERVDRLALDQMTGGAVHQGIALSLRRPDEVSLDDLLDQLAGGPALVILLDRCQDPHNLGSVIRTAEAAGASAVLVPKDRSVRLTGTVVKASAGAALRFPVISVVNVKRALDDLKEAGFWVVGLAGESSEPLGKLAWDQRTVLAVGAEGTGLAELTRKNCDFLARIPMSGQAESLNAGVAAALGAYEWARRFHFSGDF